MRWLLISSLCVGCASSPVEQTPEDRPCAATACESGVTWVAHLPTAVAGPTLYVTACRREDCVRVKVDDFGGGAGFDHAMEVSVNRLDPRTVKVDVFLDDDRRGTDGVPFRLVIEEATFEAFEIERAPVYTERLYPNGRECDEPKNVWCRRAEFDVWPTSASGLTCTGTSLDSGIDSWRAMRRLRRRRVRVRVPIRERVVPWRAPRPRRMGLRW